MSSWIHANGVIMMSTPSKENTKDIDRIKKIFKNMPYGSEGSLEYELVYCAGYLNIVICGNLRDRDDEYLNSIEKWYSSIIEKLNNLNSMYVREHVFKIYCDVGGRKRIINNM